MELFFTLLVLALIDSTSIGTLVFPILMLLSSNKVNAGRIAIYLSVVVIFYFTLGMLLMNGVSVIQESIKGVRNNTVVLYLQAAIGVVLIILGLTMEPYTKAGKRKAAARRAEKERVNGPSRFTRLKRKAFDPSTQYSSVIYLALSATAVEAASMLPYLAAIGMLTTSELSLAVRSIILVCYCIVMIIPALALVSIRIILHERIVPALTRIEAWLSRNARETTAWIVFLVGFYLLTQAIGMLNSG